MTAPSPLDLAKTGDAKAIAHLLNRALSAKGITVRGDRQGSCLVLWLESQTVLDQTWAVHTIQRGLERLQVRTIDTVQIHVHPRQSPSTAWSQAIALNQPVAHADHAVLGDSPSDHAAPQPPANPSSLETLEQTYQVLRANPDASLQSIDEAYMRLKTALLRQGKRDRAAHLKADHALFKESRQHVISHAPPEPDAPNEATLAINGLLGRMRSRQLEAQARIQNTQLQIRLEPSAAQKPNQATALIYTLLEQEDLTPLREANVSEVAIYGLASAQKIGWKRSIPLPPTDTTHNRDLMSFKNSHMNTFGFPVLLLLGIVMNAMPIVNFLLWGIKVWFHEFGHATIAWLGGRRAIPLPFGWTSVDPQRSLFVYFGLLFLFALMFWAGYREQKRWPMVLAVGLVVIQFWFTWFLPDYRFETLLSFGGVGGEFYLCTLLMVSFYLPLPNYWRWDFYRYPVVLGAAFTFWGQVGLWRQIQKGMEDIPWGSLWGGESYGDMNNLSNAGWSDQQIINTYSTISNLCLIALISVYFYFGIKENRHYWFTLSQRFLARRW